MRLLKLSEKNNESILNLIEKSRRKKEKQSLKELFGWYEPVCLFYSVWENEGLELDCSYILLKDLYYQKNCYTSIGFLKEILSNRKDQYEILEIKK